MQRLALTLASIIVVLAPRVSWSAWSDPASGSRAMVVSAHPLATEAGKSILAQGGTVVDAALAVSFALSVVEPWSSGLGGGGFMVVSQGGVVTTYDMREMAPGAATEDMYLVDGKADAAASTAGARSAGVPGLVRGLIVAWKRFGKLPLATIMKPAIVLARNGFAVSTRMHGAIDGARAKMNDAAKAIFLKNGEAPPIGAVLYQPELGFTLERIAKTEGEDFYVGTTAEELVRAVTAEGGIWNEADLATYKVVERAPVRGSYKGYEIVSMGPPSSGGVLLVQMLQVLERLPTQPWNGAMGMHQLAEVMKRAFAMRAKGLGDPDFADVDMGRFVSLATADRLAKDVKRATRATPARKIGEVKVKEVDRPDTTHFAVIAGSDGVAMTQTINLRFGSGNIAGTTGVWLNDEMDDFAVAPGVPNAFGLIGEKANAIAPKKRPLSSMTPTLVLKDGAVVGAFGSPGGSRIISTTLQVLLRVVDDGMDPAEALGAPRIHHQWYPDKLEVERFGASPETLDALKKKGHDVVEAPFMGNAMAIWKRADGVLEGAADPRGEGSAAGL